LARAELMANGQVAAVCPFCGFRHAYDRPVSYPATAACWCDHRTVLTFELEEPIPGADVRGTIKGKEQ